jgi:ABC-type transporter Mla maintaining outer membrane lipid asymmetry ATPase subunit MlaF
VMSEGRILTIGTPDQVRDNTDPAVRRFLSAEFKREPAVKL